MTVSVVIPAWNAAATLDQTLESLVAQTYGQWQAVVVDDGSTDDTRALAETWAARESRIQVVHQPNAGEAAARNRGLAQATGEWLLFLDADDWIDPRHLALMTATLSASADASAVHCGYARVTADGAVVPEPYRPPEGDLFPILARRAAFAVHACLVRRALVVEVGGFDPALKTSPDWDLWQRVARTGARFAAVPEVLAFYRMTPGSASRNARQLFVDGLRVIDTGHRADPRVPRPAPEHAAGTPEPPDSQVFYLLSWCAGLMIGSGLGPESLFDAAASYRFPELYPPAVAECLFDAVPQASCESRQAWERIWPAQHPSIERFLAELEARSGAHGLAVQAMRCFIRSILQQTTLWPSIASLLDDATATLGAERDEWRRWAEARQVDLERERQDREQREMALMGERDRWQQLATDREADLGTLQTAHDEALADVRRLDAARATLDARLAERTAERDALQQSRELALGDAMLNRWHLRRPVEAAIGLRAHAAQAATRGRLRIDALAGSGQRLKVLATACDVFPIYSQTFVYQELTSLAETTADVRFVYSKLDGRDRLATSFDWLWAAKRRLPLHRPRHERDFDHYRSRFPSQVDALIGRLAEASGLPSDEVARHDNVLQAFSFTRLVEAYRPDYLHSYFFYDRTLMAYVAATLLGIPRGVSCYADHRLKDYDLKVVPLHLDTCDIVVATSRRIREELLAIAPAMDPDRILVKPNGIDTRRFPDGPRTMPGGGDTLRLVTVCRIEPKKGLLDLVDAVRLLRDGGLAVEAHIVGDCDEWSAASRDYKRALDHRITEHGLWGAVHLEGRQPQEGVQRFLGLGHVFVAPFVHTDTGDSDGIPTAVLEAMAAALPIVATDAGSILEAVTAGVDAIVVPQHLPGALADAVRGLHAGLDDALAMGQRARATVCERFDAAHGEQAFHERVRTVAAARRRP